MGKTCSICRHPARAAIDRALASGTSASELARRYKVSVYSMRAHRENHLVFRSDKHRGDGFAMAGLGSITATIVSGATGAQSARKRRAGRKRRGRGDVNFCQHPQTENC